MANHTKTVSNVKNIGLLQTWVLGIATPARLETLEICLDVDQMNQWLNSRSEASSGAVVSMMDAFGDLDA
jgi:hypothetical protein